MKLSIKPCFDILSVSPSCKWMTKTAETCGTVECHLHASNSSAETQMERSSGLRRSAGPLICPLHRHIHHKTYFFLSSPLTWICKAYNNYKILPSCVFTKPSTANSLSCTPHTQKPANQWELSIGNCPPTNWPTSTHEYF